MTSFIIDDIHVINYDHREPILNKETEYALSGINYPDIWAMYKKHTAAIWFEEEIDLSCDLAIWNNPDIMDEHAKFFIKHILAFFAASDGIVNENLCENFTRRIKINEAKRFYNCQIFMEDVHSNTYALLLNTYITDKKERAVLFNAIETLPAVKLKADWALKWIHADNVPFNILTFVFSVVEGVFFSSSFCSIFWLKKRGIMKGLAQSNELIARDEGLHRDFACLIMSKLKYPIDEKIAEKILREAVLIEDEFVRESLPVRLIGMSADMMCQYVRYVADHLMVAHGFSPIYEVDNPFEWMTLISLENKTNFFEHRVSEYVKSSTYADGKEFSTEDTDW
jgi:ribonucleoside-diphosphate reductase beta chain